MLSRRSFVSGAVLAVVAAAGEFTATADPEGAALWEVARRRGVMFGSSTATWQLADRRYARLFARQAGLLFTEDDLLWYRLRPTPTSGLRFGDGDQIVDFARDNGQLVLGAHLVWDQGFGPGWRGRTLWNLHREHARRLLFGTIDATVRRYRGRVQAWSCANEVVASTAGGGHHGLRRDVPWYATCGPDYVHRAFHVAHQADPDATLILNDFGFETVDAQGNDPQDKQRALLHVLDGLLATGTPVHAVGLQAHLRADRFAERFDARGYGRFVTELVARGVHVMITELDVLDTGLPAARGTRDRAVAEVYRRYLDVVLDHRVAVVNTFGLTDRYSWLQQDYPRRDGAWRRPLPYDRELRPTAARSTLTYQLRHAHRHDPWRTPPRHHTDTVAPPTEAPTTDRRHG